MSRALFFGAKRQPIGTSLTPLGRFVAPIRDQFRISKQFLRDCLKIPDKPHCGLSRVLRTQPGTPFHRLACHQTQRLRTPLAIFQTVSKVEFSEVRGSKLLVGTDQWGYRTGSMHHLPVPVPAHRPHLLRGIVSRGYDLIRCTSRRISLFEALRWIDALVLLVNTVYTVA